MSSQMSSDESEVATCNIMGSTGVLIQSTLALLAFLSLVYKRWQERPRRAWSVWFLDTSKQLIAGCLQHFLNVATSYLLSDTGADPCAWYVLTITFDTTMGMLTLVTLMSLSDYIFERINMHHLTSGNYFKEVSVQDPLEPTGARQKVVIDCAAWLYQVIIYLFIVVIGKVLQYILQDFLKDPLNQFSIWLLSWLNGYPTIKLIVALFITPLLLTIIQFWVVDNLIKKSKFDQNELRLLKGGFFEALGDVDADVEIEIGVGFSNQKNTSMSQKQQERPVIGATKFEDDEPEITAGGFH